MQAAKPRFSFTKVIVDDLEKTAAFYKTLFGMHEMARVKDAMTPDRPIEEIILSLADDMSGEPPLVIWKFINEPPPKASDTILGFIVPDVDAVMARLKSAGGNEVWPPVDKPDHGVRVGFATDCDGRLLEIVQMLAAQASH